ncbi:hypothetical protein [Sphingomonas lacusdianchii]|uniref:hypothetical protein n=1 Tax=Sphingomonas lacusdianchii TaxID=2917992 RepID=UPI001F5806C1|nr:hypothetical protein [Sphingomonas sp. JXJ CY 53]
MILVEAANELALFLNMRCDQIRQTSKPVCQLMAGISVTSRSVKHVVGSAINRIVFRDEKLVSNMLHAHSPLNGKLAPSEVTLRGFNAMRS